MWKLIEKQRFMQTFCFESGYADHSCQLPTNTQLTKADKKQGESSEKNLVNSLFSELKKDENLRLIVEKWPELSVEIQTMIAKMVQ